MLAAACLSLSSDCDQFARCLLCDSINEFAVYKQGYRCYKHGYQYTINTLYQYTSTATLSCLNCCDSH